MRGPRTFWIFFDFDYDFFLELGNCLVLEFERNCSEMRISVLRILEGKENRQSGLCQELRSVILRGEGGILSLYDNL